MLRSAIVWALACSLSAAVSRADTIHNIATALDFAGFDARGSHNPLSGGADLLITRQFNGNHFDFGSTEMTFQGPISLQVSAGGRVLPQFEVAFSTAFNGQSQVTPLSYNYVADLGPQSTEVSGSTLIDGNFTINALGFYDLTLTSSTRTTVNRDGVVTDSTNYDSDLGPISVSGNIFADALAVLVDPLYEQAGRENPFSTLSKVLIDPTSDGAVNLTLSDLGPDLLMDANPRFESLSSVYSRESQTGAVVPEPTVLVLLLLGLPVVVRRAWRIR